MRIHLLNHQRFAGCHYDSHKIFSFIFGSFFALYYFQWTEKCIPIEGGQSPFLFLRLHRRVCCFSARLELVYYSFMVTAPVSATDLPVKLFPWEFWIDKGQINYTGWFWNNVTFIYKRDKREKLSQDHLVPKIFRQVSRTSVQTAAAAAKSGANRCYGVPWRKRNVRGQRSNRGAEQYSPQ